MGKSHQKYLKKEKAKVKLKGSKTLLPKGQNLTDTNFKVKKIIIKDQVKPHEKGELVTTRQLNVQDLLSRLSHHNVNMRKEALEGLNELISYHSIDVLHSHLSLLLQNVTKSILDSIGFIRKDAIKLLANIFAKNQCNMLEPFFPSLSSYLICGLTHIDCGIREDSLYFLDVLLKFLPKLCAKSAPRILPVCLDLVSHESSDNRTLSINLNSSFTSIKWRDKVLSRIRLLLTALKDCHIASQDDSLQDKEQYRRNSFPYFFKIEECICSKLQLDCQSRNYKNLDDFSLENFSNAMIPLLLDIFIETVPQKEDDVGLTTDVCTIISEEDASILTNIVEIIQLLWDNILKETNSAVKLKSLSKNHGKAFMSKLIIGKFPYAITDKINKKRRSIDNTEKEKFGSSCRVQNLVLCKLVMLFANTSDWHHIISYLKNLFRMTDVLNAQECSLFTSCVSKICDIKNFEESKYFLKQVSKTAINSNGLLANNFFLFLSEIALDRKFEFYFNENYFKSWLESLPKKLTKSKLSAQCLEKICLIAVRNHKSFSESLDALIESILDNIPRIEVEGLDKQKAQIKIASLLYYVKDWDQELIDGLNSAIKNNYWGSIVTSYIQEIQKLKLEQLGFSPTEVDGRAEDMEIQVILDNTTTTEPVSVSV